MTRTQFWILTGTVVFVCLLFGLQTYLGIELQSSTGELSRVQQVISQGRDSEVRLRQVATRTYQLSQNDPTLKNVLTRQQINVTAQATPAPTPATPAPTLPNPVRERAH